jgi:hypothetical protein
VDIVNLGPEIGSSKLQHTARQFSQHSKNSSQHVTIVVTHGYALQIAA